MDGARTFFSYAGIDLAGGRIRSSVGSIAIDDGEASVTHCIVGTTGLAPPGMPLSEVERRLSARGERLVCLDAGFGIDLDTHRGGRCLDIDSGPVPTRVRCSLAEGSSQVRAEIQVETLLSPDGDGLSRSPLESLADEPEPDARAVTESVLATP